MKKILHTIYTCLLWMGFVCFALSGCKDDELVKNNGEVVEGLPVTVTLTLSGTPAADVTIDTRADNSLSDITNLAIFVFHEDGTYEHYVSSRATDESYKVTFVKDQTVDGGVLYNVSFKTTTGKKKLIAVANTSAAAGDGGFWELTAKQEDVVGGRLSFEDIKNEIINLRSALYENSDMQPIQIVSSSLMLLSGYNEDVVFGAGGTVTFYGDDGDTNNKVIVKMDRAMAKIKFKIVEKPKDDSGNDINATFRPSSYRVYNIPTKSYLTNKDKNQTEGLFASSSETGSESETATKYVHYASSVVPSASEGFYSFEFYMPENIQETKTKNKEDKDMEYVDRDKWEGASGSIAEKKVWLNAPQNSTFVVISGTYSGTGADGKDYTGNVSYTIHLGDFSPTGSMGNFSVERNSSYTYTITVKGVDKIIAEAKKETDNEYQQGAEGQIFTYDASTYSYELDAHYEQIYLEYNLSQIAKAIQSFQVNGNSLGEYNNTQLDDDINKAIANNLILVIQSEAMDYINTTETSDIPYTVQNKRGTLKPYQIYADAMKASVNVLSAKAAVLNGPGNTTDNLKGFDYKWIEFWPQSNTEIAKYPGVSKWSRENLDNLTNKDFYGGTEVKETAKYLMDVYDVIVAMGNVVKKIYKRESVSTADRGEGYPSDSQTNDIFNSGQGITVTKNTENEYVARFTAFVNEYYYLRHPLTGERVTTWSVFTNKMNREMLIAMSSNVSEDGNSSFSTVYSYISQLSMQTFYNSRTLQMNGFGIETYNETPHIRFGGSVTTGLSDTNGRSNQILLLGDDDDTPHKWETFIDPVYNGWLRSIGSDRINHKLPVSVYEGTREESDGDNGEGGAYFACLSRNRDLNGDGVIDENEVRWYLPSINEYIRIGIGSNALSNAAQLYMGDKYTMEHKGYATSYIWDGSLYFTSSNQAGKRVYWAVERGSYGDDGANYTGNWAAKPIRCIRSLPSTSNDYDISTPFVESDPSFIYHKNTNPQSIEFKDRLVANLYRQRVDGSLGVHNEDNPANSFSQGIFVADKYLEGTYRLGDIIGYEGTVTVDENGQQKVYTFDGTMLNPCKDEKYSEDGYSDWRVPNLVELSAMNAAGLLDTCYSDKSGSFIAACCTQFSNLNVRFGFARSSLIYCPGGGAYGSENPNYSDLTSKTFRIRCVRDVPDGYAFPKN